MFIKLVYLYIIGFQDIYEVFEPHLTMKHELSKFYWFYWFIGFNQQQKRKTELQRRKQKQQKNNITAHPAVGVVIRLVKNLFQSLLCSTGRRLLHHRHHLCSILEVKISEKV